jgi:opacity protein-like surface antigen
MKNILLASAILTALVSSNAFAEDATKSTSGMYGGIDIGYGRVNTGAADTAQALANLAGETVTYSYDKGVGVGRIFLGYTINENIATEIAFFSSTKLNVNYSSAHGVANENAKASGGDISVLLRPSVSTGLNNAFLRLGAQYSKVDGSASLTYTSGGTTTIYTANGSDTGTGFLIGAGYDAPINKNTSARISYTYMDNLGGLSGANVNLLSAGLKFDF